MSDHRQPRKGRPKGSLNRPGKTSKVMITLTPDEIELIRSIGDGVTSWGILALIKFYQDNQKNGGAHGQDSGARSLG
jgi:hypothetical protein